MEPRVVDEVVKIVKRYHPAFLTEHEYNGKLPYLALSEAEYDSFVEDYKKTLPAVSTKAENYALVAKLLVPLGDAHTNVFWNAGLPLLKEIEGKICLVGVGSEVPKEQRENYFFSEVISIDGIPIAKLISKAKKLIPTETNERRSFAAVRNFSSLLFLQALGVAKDDKIKFLLENNKKYELPKSVLKVGEPRLVVPKILSKPLYYDLKMIDKILVITYTKCYGKSEAFWKDFRNELDSYLKKVSSVIVDLRGNSGGNASGFIDKIVPKIKHKTGCVLIDNGVFSAGCWTALALKKCGYSFVGETMAQPLARCGDNNSCSVMNGEVEFGVSTIYWDLYKEFDLPKSTTSKPDVWVSPKIDALKSGQDLMLEKAIEICKEAESELRRDKK